MSHNTDIALWASGLTKVFDGVLALNNLSLSIQSGVITALIGPNGAGKTTLLNVISGFLRPDHGMVMALGHDVRGMPPEGIARLGVTRTFQNIRLLPQMTVIENVLVASRLPALRGLYYAVFRRGAVHAFEEAARKSALALLRRIGLEDRQSHLAMNLSHGQRKLLELARALACKPRILMLDEPIAGLFPEMVSQVEQLLLDLRQDGTAIVVVEHRMDFVMRISDVVIVLHNGAKLAEGTPKDISRNDQVLQVYLGGSGSVDS